MTKKQKPDKKELFQHEWSPDSVRAVRKDLKLTQQDISEYLGISSDAIRKLERGDSVSPTTLLAYGDLLERYVRWTELQEERQLSEDYERLMAT